MTQRGRHVHPEYWETREQERFEDRVVAELAALRKDMKEQNGGLRAEVSDLGKRLAWLFGVLSAALFLITFLAPYIRDVLNFPTP